MSEVLYRKWRPQSFAEVVGQDAVTRTLRNSIATGRLAHAYLLCGPRGTGKTTLGRLLAKAANCTAPEDGEPCNVCVSCVAFNEGRAMDFIEQDAASHNSVEDIRQLRENASLTPMAGQRKIYLLDEVHMLSNAAQNALLKTLEEPPPHIIFVLATTESHKVSATIISRCQRFDLKRIPMNAAVKRMTFICGQEGFTFDNQSLEEIARATTGSLRDGINALEQVVSYYGKTPTPEQVSEALGLSIDVRSGQLASLALEGDLSGGLRLIAAVKDDGVDIKQFSKQLTKYLRGLLLAKAGATEALELPKEMAEEVRHQAAKLDKGDILRSLQVFGRIDWRDDHTSLPLELALVDFVSVVPAPAVIPSREHVQPTRPAPRLQPRDEAPKAPLPPPPPAPERRPDPIVAASGTNGADHALTAAPDKSAAPEPVPEAPPVPEPETVAAEPTLAPEREAVAVEPTLAPEPEPVTAQPSAPSTNGGSTADTVLDRVRRSFAETEKQLGALLNGSCEVISTDDDTVVLGFFHTFHLERIESVTFRPKLEQAFSKELGRPVKVAYQHAPRERPTTTTERKGGHLVQAAREAGARAVPPDD